MANIAGSQNGPLTQGNQHDFSPLWEDFLFFLKFRILEKFQDLVRFKVHSGYPVAILGIVAMVWVLIQLSESEILANGAFIAKVVILYYILNYLKTRWKEVFDYSFGFTSKPN
ncbi:MAG: hypothetical protein ACI9UV_003153 [Algoriphagus sp.]|jgi:hypothetical protein|tara:strand:- start:757 stop:1095 length:339 start_codon:yes stop_codon:yes gene_type:complete